MVERRLINKTGRDFSAKPQEGYDHFGKFTSELKGKPCLLDDINIKAGAGYNHMNGLSHNLYLASTKQPKNIYRAKEFADYLDRSVDDYKGYIPVSQKYKDFVAICKEQVEKVLS